MKAGWRAVAAALLAVPLFSVTASAQEAVMRASCAENGQIVYREDFPADSPIEKRILIAAQNPGAMCVFLDAPTAVPPSAAPEATGTEDAAVVPGSQDEGLAAALSIIAEGKTGDVYPRALAGVMEGGKPLPAAKARNAPAHFLSLTVGIYKDVPLADVMDHWKIMQQGSKVLARMTPTVNRLGEITVVSVENVPDELAVPLCDEAAKKGAGCVAAY